MQVKTKKTRRNVPYNNCITHHNFIENVIFLQGYNQKKTI